MDYQAPTRLQAAILDWAGTVIDFGSFAPTRIFVEAFAAFDVELSLAEARVPMGLGKWDHIRALCDQPAVAARFERRFGRLPGDADVTAIYERFMPLQIARVAEHSALIPGALEAIAALRDRGLKIGSCSGYPCAVMTRVGELAAAAGYRPDHVVAADEVPWARPGPAQALANVIALGIDDVAACVKVDDTAPGLLEGRHAGMWTVALRCSGNHLGLSWEEYQGLPAERLATERTRIHALLAASRPHYQIDTLAELPAVVADIDTRLARGESPQAS